jgi:hypothetical protein
MKKYARRFVWYVCLPWGICGHRHHTKAAAVRCAQAMCVSMDAEYRRVLATTPL